MLKWLLRFFIILVALSFLFIGFQIPVRESRMQQAIPEPVHLVSMHDNPAERMDDWLQNPLVKGVLQAVGGYPEFGQSVIQNSETREWINKFCRSKFLTGVSGDTNPDLIAVSWLGPRSWWYRYLLPKTSVRYVTEKNEHHGHPIWTYLEPLPDRKHYISFTFKSGMALGCISTNRIGVVNVLDALAAERLSFSGNDKAQRDFVQLSKKQPAKDTFWMPGNWMDGTSSQLDLTQFDEKFIAGHWRAAFPEMVDPGSAQVQEILELSEKWPSEPLGIAMVAPDLFQGYLERTLADPWPGLMVDWIKTAQAETVMLAFLGDELSGRILKMKFPSILIALKTPETETALMATAQFAQQVGGAIGMPLGIHETTVEGAGAAVRIEFMDRALARTLSDIKMVAVETEGWILVGSHREVIEKMLAASPSAEQALRAKRWRHEAVAAQNGYGWIDLYKLGKQVRTMLGFYRLKLAFSSSGDDNEALKKKIKMIQDWTESVGAMEEATFKFEVDDTVSQLGFRIGASSMKERQ